MSTTETVSVLIQSATGVGSITGVAGVDDAIKWRLHYAVALVAMLLAGVCVCRMNVLNSRKHKLKVRLHYLLMFMGSVCMAGAPWLFPRYPRVGSLVFIVCVLAGTLLSTMEWRNGPPASARTDFSPLQQEIFCETSTSSVVCRIRTLWMRVKNFGVVVAYFLRSH